jgi:hypothetical protein
MTEARTSKAILLRYPSGSPTDRALEPNCGGFAVKSSKNLRPLGLALALPLLSIAATLIALGTPALPSNDQPLDAIPELVGTRYCYGDAEVYSVWLKLRVRYINRTDKTLILDKEIGEAWYGVKVARSLIDLATGKYEYNPNIDWLVPDNDKLHDKPNTDSPGPNFAVLTPGQAFENEVSTAVVVQYDNPRDFAGSVRPGVHVFQMELSAWLHPEEASAFAKSWRKFGELVTGVIKTEPLEIRLPSDPKVEEKCE